MNKKHLTALYPSVLAVLLLSGCVEMPKLNKLLGPNYKPISNEIATIAAPQERETKKPAPKKWKPLFCRVGKGTAHFGKVWKDFKYTDFTLTPTDPTNVSVNPGYGSTTVQFNAYFDADGQKIIFCPMLNTVKTGKKVPCSSIYVLQDDLEASIKRTFDIPGAIRGGSISCAYDGEKLKI